MISVGVSERRYSRLWLFDLLDSNNVGLRGRSLISVEGGEIAGDGCPGPPAPTPTVLGSTCRRTAAGDRGGGVAPF